MCQHLRLIFIFTPDILNLDWRGDNQGPPDSVEEVIHGFQKIRDMFPGANVIASTLDAFVKELDKVRDQLPVITQEIADSWIFGCASDPIKLQATRAAVRARCVLLWRRRNRRWRVTR